jgi:hypothetical protein
MVDDTQVTDAVVDDIGILQHMHDTAGKYYLHFSTVRTTATSLVTPIGILASVNLLVNCQPPASMFAIYFLIFIIATTLFLNFQFAVWSAACRRIERRFEEQLTVPATFNPATQGFRHIFQANIKWRDGFDVFTVAVIIFDLIYLAIYWWQYRDACM